MPSKKKTPPFCPRKMEFSVIFASTNYFGNKIVKHVDSFEQFKHVETQFDFLIKILINKR